MKSISIKIVVLSVLNSLLISCSKDEKKEIVTNPLATAIIQPIGGSLETTEGIKITFPSGAVSVDTQVAIGYQGDEPIQAPGQSQEFEILGKVFTVNIDAQSLSQSAILEIPKPSGYTSVEQTLILISKKGTDTYYPLFFNESGDKLVAELDHLNYQDLSPSLKVNNNSDGYTTELFVEIIKNLQTPAINEMGFKKIDLFSDQLIFTDVTNINSSSKVLIMIHGWTGKPSGTWKEFFSKIKPKLECAGYTDYLTFGYNSSLSIEENSTILANLLQTQMNGAVVDIVAHSMGGLVSRGAIENHGCSAIVRNLVTLGTPHKGSAAANLRTLLGKMIFYNYPGSNYNINTQGFRDLIPSSTFLNNLNNNLAPTTNYYPIAALINNVLTFDGVVSESSALGIQNNQTFAIGRSFIISGFNIPHLEMTNNDDPIINHVAEKLNQFNNAPSVCDGCEDDGNLYPTVIIGNQVWMQKNLNVCKYKNGDEIPYVEDPTEWANLTTGAWCYYENYTGNGPVYGKLYNWYAVNDSRGLAPEGYHIPTDAEWTTLINFLGGTSVAGGKMKSTTLWNEPNTNATNSSGFTGLPGGARKSDGSFSLMGVNGYWWNKNSVSPQFTPVYAWYNFLNFNTGICTLSNIGSGLSIKYGLSVRCVQD